MSLYPSAPDIFVNRTGADAIASSDPNNAYDAIEAIEGYIGASGAAQSNNATLIDMLLNIYSGGVVSKKDADEIYVSPFRGVIGNADETIKKARVSTSVTTLSATDLDDGSFAVGYYYIYATADAAATTPVFVISANASAPVGYTYYKKIGWFYNESIGSLDITTGFVGNIKDASGNPNTVFTGGVVADTINDTSYGSDLTECLVRFVSSGRPVTVMFKCERGASDGGTMTQAIVDIDGTDKTQSEIAFDQNNSDVERSGGCLVYAEAIVAGTHTITIQAKVPSAGTCIVTNKHVIVTES